LKRPAEILLETSRFTRLGEVRRERGERAGARVDGDASV
jgi:hypothetical protein